MINEKKLKLAGWLSVFAAVLAFPLMTISFLSGIVQSNSVALLYLEIILNISYLAIFVYIFLMLKHLLNQIANFYDVDIIITSLIWLNIASTLITVVTLPFKEVQAIIGFVMIFLFIPVGIIYVVFGIKLLNCENDLFGYLKPFSYLTIATGTLIASIVFILFGIMTSIISDIVLALIFFKSSKQFQTETLFISEEA